MTPSVCKAIEVVENTQNKGNYTVQGHSRSSRSVPVESPYALKVTDILSRTGSELSQLIVQILDTAFFSPLGGLGTTYIVLVGLIEKRMVDFLLVIIELFFASCYGCVIAFTVFKFGQFGVFEPTFEGLMNHIRCLFWAHRKARGGQ